MAILLLAIIAGGAMPVTPAKGQSFTNVTATSGINYLQNQYTPSSLGEYAAMTGGAAAGDYDGDGWIDLYVTRLDRTDILYRNVEGYFEDVTASAFLSGQDPNTGSNGASWGDIDNDGDLDLYVTSIDSFRYHLFVNDGNGHFTEEAIERGASLASPISHSGYSSTFGDYDNDGFLDLYTSEWNQLGVEPPALRSHARLLRNQGTVDPGHFSDATQAAGVYIDDTLGRGPLRDEMQGVYTFAPRFSDLDHDGHIDLAIVGDFHTSRIFWNNRNGTFTDGTAAANVATDENGMGSAIGDYDGDGDLDWFVTSISGTPSEGVNWGSSGNRLYRNNGDRTFTDATDQAGVRDGGWGWAAAWLDYDNDSDLDLIMTNGMFISFSEDENDFNQDPMRLWRNDEGIFTEVSAEEGITDTGTGKGLLTFDFDNNGTLDVFVVNNAGQPVLYRNQTDNGNHYLRLRTRGTNSNADGLGAWITVTPHTGPPQVRQMNAGSHFLGQSENIAHFGLGVSEASQLNVDLITIEWPSGIVQSLVNVKSNQDLTVTEPLQLADSDLDEDVDLDDLSILAGNWLGRAGWAGGDFNGTGEVGPDDLAILQSQWLTGAGGGAPGLGLSFDEALEQVSFLSTRFGDANGDYSLNNLDITPFIEALTIGGSVLDPTRQDLFDRIYPGGLFATADVNADLMANNLDVTPFIAALSAPSLAAPEPASAWLLGLLGICVGTRRPASQS